MYIHKILAPSRQKIAQKFFVNLFSTKYLIFRYFRERKKKEIINKKNIESGMRKFSR